MSSAAIERALASTARREARLDRRACSPVPAWRSAAASRIPEKAEAALRAAFARAFALLFERPALLEYGVRPDELAALFSARDAAFDARPGRASLRRLGSGARRANSLKAAASAVEGVALGALGIGLPDIVLFLALLMRGVRATARSWGFGCDTAAERLYMLRLMRCALSRGGERAALSAGLDDGAREPAPGEFELELRRTADAFALGLLTLKFVQGIPLAGAAAGAANPVYYRKITRYAELKYQKRYLMLKLASTQ